MTSVHFPSQDTGYVAGFGGKIFKTTNGGNNWVSKNSILTAKLSSIFFTDVNNGFSVGEGGIVLKTTNGGIHGQAYQAEQLKV